MLKIDLLGVRLGENSAQGARMLKIDLLGWGAFEREFGPGRQSAENRLPGVRLAENSAQGTRVLKIDFLGCV